MQAMRFFIDTHDRQSGENRGQIPIIKSNPAVLASTWTFSVMANIRGSFAFS
ncbi:hypothetical protein [Azovibrio restrictus]|uniref:hypothetical protein n=1 Tax=Azovibrio restrictus TaxID=146938 RepID=UPI0012EC22DC|nr:hypothetical protein [Azovibrio restrictus]